MTRKEKVLGFAVRPEEEEDYLACLNFFREAQQTELNLNKDDDSSQFVKTVDSGELYERSLSIRYCYPRLLQSKLKESTNKQDEVEPLINRLPPEM